MANRTVTLNMDANVSYTKIAVVYAEVGDTVIATVNGAGSSYHWGEVSGSLPNGSPAWDDHGTTWSYTVVGTDQDADYYVDAMFFSPYNPQDGTAATHSGRVRINIPNPIFTGATANNTIAANVTATLSATPTHLAPTQHSGVDYWLEYRQGTSGNWQQSNTFSHPRGTTKVYSIMLYTDTYGNFGGVSAAGAGDEYYTRSITVNHIATPSTATLTPSSTSVAVNTAYTLPAVSSNYDTGVVYYLTTVGGSGYSVGTAYTGIWTGYIARTQNSSQFKNKDNLSSTTRTSPSTAGTTTYYAWNLRPTGNGGDGLYYYAGPAFTLTTTTNTGTVSGLSLGENIDVDQTLSYILQRNSGTITCDPTTFQPTSSVSDVTGSAYAKQRLGGTSNSYSTSNLTLSNGQSVDFQMTGPAGYDSTTTGKLTIAEDDASVSVSTQPQDTPGGGGGGSSAGTYGLRVYKADGTVIFGDGIKSAHQIASQSITTPLAANASTTYTLTDVPYADADSARIGIVIVDMYTGSSQVSPYWSVTRSNNSGSLAFTVTNGSGAPRPYRYVVTRY